MHDPDVRYVFCLQPTLELLEHRTLGAEGDDLSARFYRPCEGDGEPPGTAAAIQYPHARGKAEPLEQEFGAREGLHEWVLEEESERRRGRYRLPTLPYNPGDGQADNPYQRILNHLSHASGWTSSNVRDQGPAALLLLLSNVRGRRLVLGMRVLACKSWRPFFASAIVCCRLRLRRRLRDRFHLHVAFNPEEPEHQPCVPWHDGESMCSITSRLPTTYVPLLVSIVQRPAARTFLSQSTSSPPGGELRVWPSRHRPPTLKTPAHRKSLFYSRMAV